MNELVKLLSRDFPHHSQNLRKFINKRGNKKKPWRIIREKWNPLDGHCEWKDGTLYLAYSTDDGLTCGAKLLRLRCGGFDTFAHIQMGEVRDETEWFIREYKSKGMCYEGDHNHEFKEINFNKRECRYCLKREVRRSKMIEEIWWE